MIKKNLSQPGLTRQTLDSSRETEITFYKANQNKLWCLILNQPKQRGIKFKKNELQNEP